MDSRFLEILREAALQVASAETSCYPDFYEHRQRKGLLKSPLDGHCAAMAHLVQGVYGGEIVTGRIEGAPHYWNRLPDGTEVDLTSCQFGGDGYTPLKKGRKVKRGELVNPRFLLFAEMVRRAISNKEE